MRRTWLRWVLTAVALGTAVVWETSLGQERPWLRVLTLVVAIGVAVLFVVSVVTRAPRAGAGAVGPVSDSGGVAAPDFTLVPRGYDRSQVDELVERALRALRGGDPVESQRAALAVEAAMPQVRVVMRGYDRAQVESFVEWLRVELGRRAAEG